MSKILFSFLFVFIVGCTQLEKPIDIREEPNSDNSYIYGRFFVNNNSASLYGETEIALVLHNLNTDKNYYFRFEEDEPVQLIKLEPGNYSIPGIAFLDHFNRVVSNVLFEKKDVDIKFKTIANNAYYVGDYKGYASWTGGAYHQHWDWEIDLAENNFKKTTFNFINKYPFFAHITNHDIVKNELEKLGMDKRYRFKD